MVRTTAQKFNLTGAFHLDQFAVKIASMGIRLAAILLSVARPTAACFRASSQTKSKFETREPIAVQKKLSAKFALALLVLCGVFRCDDSLMGQTPPDGFEALFNGQDLQGWFAMETYDPRVFAALSSEEQNSKIAAARESTAKFWRVENGEIVNDGEGPYLTSEKSYRDFELLIEYRTVAGADSGIYLKATPQVQIWDFTDEAKFNIGSNKGSGGLWNNSPGAAGKDPSELADRAFGEWNQFKIRQIGARTDVWLNGKQIVANAVMENYWDRTLPLIASGPIQLQTHGGEIRWKNVFCREIPVAEANQILSECKADGFVSIFNGTDFSGWQGPIDNYQISNGVIQCLPEKGGTIFTADEYADFVARLEFKLPPGGNNGLAIRYPGAGDTAYEGMCELQVLDNDAEKFATLDPRQYHGSAYGMVAAHRGFLRPSGEWNFQEVTVQGSKIKVELNGSIILDCDVSEVTDYMANSPHPGKDRVTGHFGLAGHSDPVEFRNLKIKTLK